VGRLRVRRALGGALIRSASDFPNGFTARTDVCVIGSGSGGGVATGLLAGAGRDVFLIEEGPHVPAAKMTQREDEMFPLLFRDGGQQTTADGTISVLQGRALGGSTVINMADVVPIPDGVWAHWETSFGLTRYSLDNLREADAACGAAIGANQMAVEALNRNNALLLAGGRKLGLTGGRFVHNRVGCVGSGYCLIGCAYDAKRSVAVTWIPRALETGHLTVQTEARATHFETDGKRVVAVVGELINPRDNRSLATFRVEADHFVLAAGAIHSPVLLQASGLGGPRVGRNLSLQPQAAVAALFDEDVVMFRGIPQAAYIDSTETATEAGGLGGYRLEGVAAGPGQAAQSLAMSGADVHAFMTHYRQAASCLCLVPDRPVGTVTRDRVGRPKIAYAMTDGVRKTLKEAVHTASRAYLAAGARSVVLPLVGATPVEKESDLDQLKSLDFRPVSMISAHPQGTCRMGPDAETSVVDPSLRVHGVDNLHVVDASVFPTTSSSHTMMPVMAMSWLAMQEML